MELLFSSDFMYVLWTSESLWCMDCLGIMCVFVFVY